MSNREPLYWWWVTPFYLVWTLAFSGMGFRIMFTLGQYIGAPLALLGALGFIALCSSGVREAIL